jgi:hypothetical protein
MQPEPEVTTHRQDRVRTGREVSQHPSELGECLRRLPVVQIIDDQRDAAAGGAEFREHPVDHRPPVEIGRRGERFRLAGDWGGIPHGAEQGKPEELGVVLVAFHLDDGDPVPRAGTTCPDAQPRRLPAPGRSRDGRQLPRRRAIESGEKGVPGDQPGSRRSHRHRGRPRLGPVLAIFHACGSDLGDGSPP